MPEGNVDSAGGARTLADVLAWWESRHAADRGEPTAPDPAPEPVLATRALRAFLSRIAERPAPVLLDLGPVVPSNLTLFAEGLSCKVIIEDLARDLDAHARADRLDALASDWAPRFARPDGSIDGVLCWDVFDYLDRETAAMVARELTRLLRPDGVLLAFFSTTPSLDGRYTRFVIADDLRLRLRPFPGVGARQPVLQNREITHLFDRLRVAESYLLQTNLRELLFRKPAYLD